MRKRTIVLTGGACLLACFGSYDSGLRAQNDSAPAKERTSAEILAEFQKLLYQKVKEGDKDAVQIYQQAVKSEGKLSLTQERMKQLIAKWKRKTGKPGQVVVNVASAAEGKDVDYNVTTEVLKSMRAGLPADDKILAREDVSVQRDFLWRLYKKSAAKAGWDSQLLKSPEPVQKMIAEGKAITLTVDHLRTDGKSMPYLFVTKGRKPKDGWPMFICLHGGGKYGGEEKIEAHGWNINNSEWQAQMQLSIAAYEPAGIYFVPRMADDRLGRWWHKHNIEIITGMIRRAVLFNDVNPNKVYIMGISQGGYGTGHLAPFMADLFAAAGPMAGGMMTVTENLRNLPYRTDIGELDTAFDRIKMARELHDKINEHKASDPEGYTNLLAVQQGRGHGIDYRMSPKWMGTHTRNPHPEKIVWRCHEKDGLYRDSFYWLSLSDKPKSGEFQIIATLDRTNNAVEIKGWEEGETTKDGEKRLRKPLTSSKIVVHLNDDMLDLDKEVVVKINGKVGFKGKVKRSRESMMLNLLKRGDINYAFPVNITVGTR